MTEQSEVRFIPSDIRQVADSIPPLPEGQALLARIGRLEQAALRGENVFDALLETVKVASLGQTSEALFEVGGRYRRAM